MAAQEAEPMHIVGWFQHLLDRVGLKVPRALCGELLSAPEPTPEPGPDAPICGTCKTKARW